MVQELMKTSPVIRAFTAIMPLSEKEIEDFAHITKQQKLTKGEYWIKENKRNDKIAFLLSGYLRKYYIDNDGREITDSFYFESEFCTDLPSIIGNTKPSSNVVAMEDTFLITFSNADFDRLRIRHARFERIYSKLLEQTFLRFYNRVTSLIRQSAKERYRELLQANPVMLQKVTQYHIASYLGISHQHLSRLRSAR